MVRGKAPATSQVPPHTNPLPRKAGGEGERLVVPGDHLAAVAGYQSGESPHVNGLANEPD